MTGARGGSPSITVPDHWWYRVREPMLEAALGQYVPRGGRLLDIGSADAPSAEWLSAQAGLAVALDVDVRGLAAARNGVCGSAGALPFRDRSFDVVSAFDVIEHIDPEDAVLDEVGRVLVPGGWFLVSVPAYQWAWSDHDVANGHHRRYTRTRLLASLRRHGFTPVRATYAYTTVFPFFAAERMGRRLRGPRVVHAQDVVTLPATPSWVDRLMTSLSGLDIRALSRGNLPFGSSIFAAAVRTGPDQ